MGLLGARVTALAGRSLRRGTAFPHLPAGREPGPRRCGPGGGDTPSRPYSSRRHGDVRRGRLGRGRRAGIALRSPGGALGRDPLRGLRAARPLRRARRLGERAGRAFAPARAAALPGDPERPSRGRADRDGERTDPRRRAARARAHLRGARGHGDPHACRDRARDGEDDRGRGMAARGSRRARVHVPRAARMRPTPTRASASRSRGGSRPARRVAGRPDARLDEPIWVDP